MAIEKWLLPYVVFDEEQDTHRLIKYHSYGYYEQAQTIMSVCDVPKLNFVIWTPIHSVHFEFPFDQEYWKK